MQGLQVDIRIAFMAGVFVTILVEIILVMVCAAVYTFRKKYRIVRVEEASE